MTAAVYEQVACDVARSLRAATPLGVEPRIGTDVQAVAPVLESISGPLRDAYLQRLFTAAEMLDAGLSDAPLPVVAESLAARFAAKEAVLKVLDLPTGAARPAWTDIEIRRLPSGRPDLVLYGTAALLARAARLTSWTCSLAHDPAAGGVAVATVAALALRAVPRPREARHVHR